MFYLALFLALVLALEKSSLSFTCVRDAYRRRINSNSYMPQTFLQNVYVMKVTTDTQTTGQQQWQLCTKKKQRKKQTTETTIWRPKIDLFQEIRGNGIRILFVNSLK